MELSWRHASSFCYLILSMFVHLLCNALKYTLIIFTAMHRQPVNFHCFIRFSPCKNCSVTFYLFPSLCSICCCSSASMMCTVLTDIMMHTVQKTEKEQASNQTSMSLSSPFFPFHLNFCLFI